LEGVLERLAQHRQLEPNSRNGWRKSRQLKLVMQARSDGADEQGTSWLESGTKERWSSSVGGGGKVKKGGENQSFSELNSVAKFRC
jgi:hypothetical protein